MNEKIKLQQQQWSKEEMPTSTKKIRRKTSKSDSMKDD
jgi:hypothetical protein